MFRRSTIIKLLVGIAAAAAVAMAIELVFFTGSDKPATATPEAVATPPAPVTWHRHCSAKYGFCARFPSRYKGDWRAESQEEVLSATGVATAFWSYVSVDEHGELYRDGPYRYAVLVFRSAVQDPWSALKAIDHTARQVRLTVHGSVAAHWVDGGVPSVAIWHRGLVYHMFAPPTYEPDAPPFSGRFMASISFTS